MGTESTKRARSFVIRVRHILRILKYGRRERAYAVAGFLCMPAAAALHVSGGKPFLPVQFPKEYALWIRSALYLVGLLFLAASIWRIWHYSCHLDYAVQGGKQMKNRMPTAISATRNIYLCFLLCILPLVNTGCMSIHTAARKGNRKAVRARLAVGTNPNSRHFFTRETPLIEAAANGHIDVVRLLIERGADVNKKGEAWYGPLHVAAGGGHLEVVRLLLDYGADVNVFSHDKPLHYAARNGHIEVARVLLAHGADIDAKGMSEQTPLVTAVSSRQVEMVNYLLSKGADVNARANYGRTALYSSYSNDDVEVGQILLRHGADVTLEFSGKRIPEWFIERLRRGN